MANNTQTRESRGTALLLQKVLQEIRALRQDLLLLLPEDALASYAHAARIKRSYQKATKRYPPVSLWK